jgi:LmbE family N-acetylglucosaminyl deacetylase
MRPLGLARADEALTVLCLGAHSDDIEIGAGGTILALIASGARLNVHWCVLSAVGARGDEAAASAEAFLAGAAARSVTLATFQDGYFPHRPEIKDWFEELKARVKPDLVFTHRRDDAHQDHRTVCDLTWNSFRNHLIFEYEIPKWDGDTAQPNSYMPLSAEIMERKCALLETHFGTQRSKDWFDPETFRGLARLRGMECRAAERYAEGFVMRKALLSGLVI